MPGPYVYNNNVPQVTQSLSETQGPIQTNFASIQSLVEQDHVTFNAANAGKHNQATLPELGASPTTAVNEGALFSREGATTGITELAFRRENNGAVIEMTEGNAAAVGWSRLPSGILVKWGNNTTTGIQDILVNHGPAFQTLIFNWALITTTNTFANTMSRFVSCLAVGAFPSHANLRVNGCSINNTATATASQCTYIIMGI